MGWQSAWLGLCVGSWLQIHWEVHRVFEVVKDKLDSVGRKSFFSLRLSIVTRHNVSCWLLILFVLVVSSSDGLSVVVETGRKFFSLEYQFVHFFNFKELHDFDDIIESRLANIGHMLRLLDRFLHTDQIATIFVLTQHRRVQFIHFLFQLLVSSTQSVCQEGLLSEKHIRGLSHILESQEENLILLMFFVAMVFKFSNSVSQRLFCLQIRFVKIVQFAFDLTNVRFPLFLVQILVAPILSEFFLQGFKVIADLRAFFLHKSVFALILFSILLQLCHFLLEIFSALFFDFFSHLCKTFL